MNSISKNGLSRTIAGVMAFVHLVFSTSLVSAKPAEIADMRSSRSFMVLPLKTESVQKDDLITELSDVIREDLGRRYIVVGGDQTNEIADYYGDTVDTNAKSIIGYMDKANDAYFLKGDPKGALVNLEKAIDELRRRKSIDEGQSELLVKALTAKAKISFEVKDTKASQSAVESILEVMPEYNIEKKYFTPTFQTFFESVRGEIKASPKGSLKIDSTPKAVQVYLNGIYAGITPVTLSDLRAGKYDVVMSTDHRTSVKRGVVIEPGLVKELGGTLAWDTTKDAEQPEISSGAIDEMIDRAVSIGSVSGVDRVVLVGIDGSERPFAMMIDVSTMQNFKNIRYRKLGNVEDQAPKVASYFVKKLNAYANTDILEAAKEDVGSSTIVDQRIHYLKKKPLYKRPVFWTVIGLALLGGLITGVVMAVGGGGAAASTGTLSLVFE